MLCSEKESMVVVGMGVFYKQKCEVWPSEDIERFCKMNGFSELSPTIALSRTALDVHRMGKTFGVDEITYLEMLVTTSQSRGKGVARGIVHAVEDVEEGVIAAVASSEGTARILRRRDWQVWNTLDCSQFVFRDQKLFSGVKPITVFMKDMRK